MNPQGTLAKLLRRARGRHLLRLLAVYTVHTLAVSAAGGVALLVAGADVLNWRWIVAVAAAAMLLSVVRMVGEFPTPYRILQGIDRRLQLHDTLSTAFYFGDSRRCVAEPLREALLRQAEELARGVDLRQAVPIAAPRSAYALAVLLALASALFALRYAATHRLDLRPPLASILFPSEDGQRSTLHQARKKPIDPRWKQWLRQIGLSSAQPAPGSRLTSESLPAEAPADAQPLAEARPPELPRSLPLTAGEEMAEEGDGDSTLQAGKAGGDSPEEGAPGQDPAAARQAWPNQNSSLLEQFREALASLLSQLKSRPASGGSQAASREHEGSPSARSRTTPAEKGAPAGGQKSEGDGASEGDGEPQSEAVEQARSATGKPGGRDGDVQPAREGRSGIGKEDGRKDTREAEQLAAMGKLSELFGRRQATLTGEVTVEVASGTQKLRTAYSERSAAHAEAGGEIHRDEVPLLFQHYVQRYFEQLHKASPAGAPSGERRGDGGP